MVVLGIVVVADRAMSNRSLAEEWPPETSLPYLARSVGLAMASVLLIFGTRGWLSSVLDERPGPAPPVGVPAVLGGLAMALSSVVLLLANPELLNRLAGEDNLFEWTSALLGFAAAGFAALAARSHWRGGSRSGNGRLTATGLAVYGGLFLLLGLEEVSWFQRVFDVESPEAFVNRNLQGETNLHNLATTATGNGYFIGGFLFCVAIPYLLADRTPPTGWRWIEPLVPTRTVMYATAIAGAIVYEMWNVIWIQMTFWMALAAVVLAGVTRAERRLAAIVASAMIVTAVAFLFRGDAMVRSWDDTEIRELIIPYGFVLYAGHAWLRSPGRHG